jgi:4-carboxymuconolactone decarboxylase
MARVPDIVVEELSLEQRTVYDKIVAGPRGAVGGPLRVWLNNPAFADIAQELGIYCRYGTSLPAKLSELVILVVVGRWRAGMEFAAHAKIGLNAGLNPDIVEALRTGKEPQFDDAEEALIYGAATELLNSTRLSQTTYDKVIAAFGRTGLTDLIGILGYYTMIAMTVTVFEVDMPGGAPDPFQ